MTKNDLTKVIHWITFVSRLKVITVAETSEFSKRAKKLLSDREKFDLIAHLAAYPKSGDVLEGTDLLTIYGKSEKDDLSSKEQKELAKLADLLIQEGSKRKRGKKT